MANKWELLRQFKASGINVQDDILNCAVDMCGRLFIDEREIVESWVTYSLTNLDGAKPTVELLLQMEQREFSDKSLNTSKDITDDLASYDFGSTKRKKEVQEFSSDEDISPPKKLITESSIRTSSASSRSASVSDFSPKSDSEEVLVSFKSSVTNWESKELSVDVSLFKVAGEGRGCLQRSDDQILSESAKQIAKSIAENNKLALNVDVSCEKELDSQEVEDEKIFAGRILSSDSELQVGNIQIQSLNNSVLEVDIKDISEYSIFPGQVVIYKGTRRGKKIIGRQMFSSARLNQPNYSSSITDPLHIVVASGPFTHSDSLLYEPLQDLIKYVKVNKPHVMILIGPIIDSNHALMKNGSMNDSSQFLQNVLNEIEKSLESCGTQYFILASGLTNHTYPTKSINVDEKWKNIILPDPSILNVDGLLIGITSVDILSHLDKKELTNDGEKLSRLAAHILKQQSFYPLYPPDNSVTLDLNSWYLNARLPVTPHILIIPSDMENFIEDIDGTVALNPGRLSNHPNGSAYACIEVQPPSLEWSPSSHIAMKIVKI